MKNTKTILALFAAVLITSAGAAWADSLSVVPEAAMGGTNFGMRIDHDNSSEALVRDNSPTNEEVYRSEFLFKVDDVNTTQNYRQLIYLGVGLTPTPNQGDCGSLKFASVFRVFHQTSGGIGQNSGLVAWVTGNLCGARGMGLLINRHQEYRVCIEWERSDLNLGGRMAMAAVDSALPCPPSGDPAYVSRDITNSRVYLDQIELGTPRRNLLGVGETSTLFFDEFASFRTLAP